MALTAAVPALLVAVLAATLVHANALAAETKVDAEEMQPAQQARRVRPEADARDEVADDLLSSSSTSSSSLSPLLARGYKKMAQTILPLLVGFKATGMLTAAIAITKLILLKAVFLSTTALLVAGLLALKKFLSLGHPHDVGGGYTYQHQDLSHVPYLHAVHGHTAAAADYMEPQVHVPQVHVPQVTYIGGSYGLQSIPYSAPGGLGAAGAGAVGSEDVQGLYSAPNSVATLSSAQLLQHQALLAQQLGNTTQAQQALQLSRRRLSAPQGATVSSPYPYRPSRPEARLA